MKRFLYRVFFDKTDGLDLSQVTLLGLNGLFAMWVIRTGQGAWVVNEPLLNAFLVVYMTTVVLASPTWLARLWIEKRWRLPVVMAHQQQDGTTGQEPDGTGQIPAHHIDEHEHHQIG